MHLFPGPGTTDRYMVQRLGVRADGSPSLTTCAVNRQCSTLLPIDTIRVVRTMARKRDVGICAASSTNPDLAGLLHQEVWVRGVPDRNVHWVWPTIQFMSKVTTVTLCARIKWAFLLFESTPSRKKFTVASNWTASLTKSSREDRSEGTSFVSVVEPELGEIPIR